MKTISSYYSALNKSAHCCTFEMTVHHHLLIAWIALQNVPHYSVCSNCWGTAWGLQRKRTKTKASFMMLAGCLCGWLKSLETLEGNPPDLQRDSTVGSVGRLLVCTDCIPYITTPVNRPAHINTASPTNMDGQVAISNQVVLHVYFMDHNIVQCDYFMQCTTWWKINGPRSPDWLGLRLCTSRCFLLSRSLWCTFNL